MSHLSLPRIHFKGKFVTNPGTANNEDSMQPVLTVGANVKLNLEELRIETTEDFTRHIENQGPLRGLFNVYGDNEFYFDEAKVTSVEYLEPNGKKSDPFKTEDPLIGAAVALNKAVIVDINTQSAFGPQIFADEFIIQSGDHPRGPLLFKGQPTKSVFRFHHLSRNLGLSGFGSHGAVFQFSMPAASLVWSDRITADVEENDFLCALRRAIDKGDAQGLTVRMCLYAADHSFRQQLTSADRDQEMARLFAQGQKVENPTVGCLVGTVGLWHEGELASVTMGRILGNRDIRSFCGPAVAVVDKERAVVSVDLVNSFPEKDDQLDKIDIGPVSLVLMHGGKEYKIGQVLYDKLTYEKTSGVVDIECPAAVADKLESGLLAIRGADESPPLLAEIPFMIDSDDKCTYMHEGETREFLIHALYLGAKAPSKPTLLDITIEKDVSTAEGIAISILEQNGYNISHDPLVEIQGPNTVLITPGEPAKLVLKALAVGSVIIFCRADPLNPPDHRFNLYFNIRILPDDSRLAAIPDEQLKFDLVYKEVLQYYNLLHPAMRHVFDLSREEHWTPRWAKRVLERIDPDKKDRYEYMPRTRDMSEGRRKLLERWCKLVIAAGDEKDKFNNPRDPAPASTK